MKIALAQISSQKGDVIANINKHVQFIKSAVAQEATIIFFPELSITGYEPTLAKELATTPEDARFGTFKALSHQHKIAICVGVPLQAAQGILIGMVIFQPDSQPIAYSKQILHADEYPYFVAGNSSQILVFESHKIVPAICYESLQDSHSVEAVAQGATIYVASVAKSAKGVEKAYSHYPKIARQHQLYVLMVNSIGKCDDFVAVGQSAVWNPKGEKIASLNATEEGLLVVEV